MPRFRSIKRRPLSVPQGWRKPAIGKDEETPPPHHHHSSTPFLRMRKGRSKEAAYDGPAGRIAAATGNARMPSVSPPMAGLAESGAQGSSGGLPSVRPSGLPT